MKGIKMDKIKSYFGDSFNYLDEILTTNIVLKYFNLIDWDWNKVIWPLWVEIVIALLIFWWKNTKDD